MPTTQKSDRLPQNLLTDEEVIDMLRLDASEISGEKCDRGTSLRRLRYLRDKRKISYHRVGNRTFLYPRAAISRYLKQNLIEAR